MKDLFFSLEEIKDAYLKLKNYIYYDKTALFSRAKLAKFEKYENIYDEEGVVGLLDFDEIEEYNDFWNKITKRINAIINDDNYCAEYLNKISARIMPKNIMTQHETKYKENKKTSQLISNRAISKKYYINDINYHIDLPIELLIIDTLWITKCGYALIGEKCEYMQTDLNNCSYANELCLNKNGLIKKGKNLFKHYYNQYPKWRDNAIKEVENLYGLNKSALIFSLDIKKYYYNIDLNYAQIDQELTGKGVDENSTNLTKTIEQIHLKYRSHLNNVFKTTYENNFLPIGLLSSNILSNWYLKRFDRLVLNQLNPTYYGRYVDDLLFVFEDKFICQEASCTKEICPEENNLSEEALIESFLGLIIKKSSDNNKLKISGYKNLYIQKNKVKIFLIDANSPNIVLEQFKTNIATTTSQFQFLPDDREIDDEYIKKTFFVHYTDSVNKLRSVENCTLDKFSTSILLSKKIQIAKYMKSSISHKNVKQMTQNYFNGKYGLVLNSLWHKLFAYFLIIDKEYSAKEITMFYENINTCIDKIIFSPGEKNANNSQISKKLRKDLREYLDLSLALATSLNPNFAENKLRIKNQSKIFETCLDFQYSNMFCQDHISLPGYNFTNKYFSEISANNPECIQMHTNLINQNFADFFDGSLENKLGINENLSELSPLSLTLENKNLLDFYSIIFDSKHCNNDISTINEEIIKRISNLEYPAIEVNYDNNESYNEIKINGNLNETGIRIGVSNLQVEEGNILSSIKGETNLSEKKYSQIRDIVTQAQKHKVDLLVFPEVSIPLEWLPLLHKHLKSKKMGMIFGLEHVITQFSDKKYCCNFLVTMLPCDFEAGVTSENTEQQNFMLVKPRLKNYYSPEEKNLIIENNLMYPNDPYIATYDLFNWRGLYFSSYNCYEIACITDRAIMRSKIDFLSISEWNKDTKYFDNIIQSASRDLHCYIVQVNTSKYGHSCIISPKKSEFSTPVFIKGGLNSTLLVEEINFKELRDFQRKNQNFYKDNKFKPLPPCYDQANERLKK